MRGAALVVGCGVFIHACSLSRPTCFALGPPGCPTVYTSTSAALVDDECLFGRCTVAVAQNGCDLDLTWGAGCPMLPEHGVVARDGTVSFAASDPVGVCQARA